MLIRNLRLEGYRINYYMYCRNNRGTYHIEYLAIFHFCTNTLKINKVYYVRNKVKAFYKIFEFNELYYKEKEIYLDFRLIPINYIGKKIKKLLS